MLIIDSWVEIFLQGKNPGTLKISVYTHNIFNNTDAPKFQMLTCMTIDHVGGDEQKNILSVL